MGSWGHGLLGSDMGSWGQTWEAVQEFPVEIHKSLPSNGLRISSLIKVVSLLARTYGKKRRILGQPPSAVFTDGYRRVVRASECFADGLPMNFPAWRALWGDRAEAVSGSSLGRRRQSPSPPVSRTDAGGFGFSALCMTTGLSRGGDRLDPLSNYPKTLSSPGFYGGYTPFSDSYLLTAWAAD